MLEKEYVKQLLKEEKYNEINDYMYNSYSKILENYIVKNGLECENTTLMVKASIISKKFPKHAKLMDVLLEVVLDENKILVDRLNEMIDFYKVLKRQLV